MGMEACAGSHHWCRELEALGFEMKLIAAGYVKAYVRGNKNDYNDALAIAEAVVRPEMRFVAVKTPEQQDIQALHRVRRGCIDARTALCNQMRGVGWGIWPGGAQSDSDVAAPDPGVAGR